MLLGTEGDRGKCSGEKVGTNRTVRTAGEDGVPQDDGAGQECEFVRAEEGETGDGRRRTPRYE